MRLLTILFALSLLFIVPIVGAQVEERDVFRQNLAVDLQQPCFNNGTYCSTSATCNITLSNAVSVILIDNQLMTNQGAFHNFTINESDTSILGTYEYRVACVDSGAQNFGTFNFLITPSGTNPSTSQGLIYLSVLALSLVFLGASLFGAIQLPWNDKRDEEGLVVGVNDLKWLKLFFWMMTYLFAIWVAWLAWKIGVFFTFFDIGVGVFKMIFWVLISFMVPVFSILIISGWVSFFRTKELKELLDRGISQR